MTQISSTHLSFFREDLIAWFDGVKRDMPWRRTSDPYRIWISEIMLQQTRVDQATGYYNRFTSRFPTVETLAEADQDEVLLYWEGLGYYSRARNLHRAARQIVAEHDGHVPDTEKEIRDLPGVGPYTSAAVLSIAYDRPLAVLDGNVARVLTRVFTISDDVKKPATRTRLQSIADALLNPDRPGDFNQAVMELGATICTPKSPSCHRCPIRPTCAACAAGTPTAYPVSAKKKPIPHRQVVVGIVQDGDGRLLITRRPDDAMLGGLWEFPGGKQEEGETLEAACRRELKEELGIEVEVGVLFDRLSHTYSHFKITLHAFLCRIVSGTPNPSNGMPMAWVEPERLDEYAFPRANRRLIDHLIERKRNPGLFDGFEGVDKAS